MVRSCSRVVEQAAEQCQGQDLPQLLKAALQQHADTNKVMQERLQQQQADLQALSLGLDSGMAQQQKQQQELLNVQVSNGLQGAFNFAADHKLNPIQLPLCWSGATPGLCSCNMRSMGSRWPAQLLCFYLPAISIGSIQVLCTSWRNALNFYACHCRH